MLTTASIKSLHLQQEGLFLEALNLLQQAQAIAASHPDFVRFEQEFARQAVRMREAMAKEAA